MSMLQLIVANQISEGWWSLPPRRTLWKSAESLNGVAAVRENT